MHIQSDFDQHNIKHMQHCMNGEADNFRFVSMHVNMHLKFKEAKVALIYTSSPLPLINYSCRTLPRLIPGSATPMLYCYCTTRTPEVTITVVNDHNITI